MAKLDVKAFGIACGILWAATIVLLGVLNMFFGLGTRFLLFFAKFYLGYNSNILGIFIGAAWAFIDAGIGGVALAWLYNKLSK